jgi:hypothetical protein
MIHGLSYLLFRVSVECGAEIPCAMIHHFKLGQLWPSRHADPESSAGVILYAMRTSIILQV